jgi:hypothetical protein
MDATKITTLTAMANKYIARESKAREELAARLADMTKPIDGSDLRRVTEATAAALPFRMLLEDADGDDFGKAFTRLRQRLTRTLLSTGPAHTSCAMTNEAERIRFACFRDFLSITDDYAL